MFPSQRDLVFLGFIFLWGLIFRVKNAGQRDNMKYSIYPWFPKANQSRETEVSASGEDSEAKLFGRDSCTQLFQGNRCNRFE